MPPIYVEHVKGVNVGAGGENASYAFSFFGPQVAALGGHTWSKTSHGIDIIDLHVDNTMQQETHGALLCEGKKWVTVKDSTFNMGENADRGIMKIDGCEKIVVENCEFNVKSGQNAVKIKS